ncbi:unnamed protein product [Aphanomyces euteiches]
MLRRKGLALLLVFLVVCYSFLYPTTPENHYQVNAAVRQYILALRAVNEQRTGDAENHYKAAIREYEFFGPAINNLGILMHKKGLVDAALELHAYAVSVALQEKDWETFASAQNNLGYLVRRGHEKSYEQTLMAIHHFDQALQISPPNCSVDVYVSLLYNKASALYGIGQLDEAQALLVKVLALDPSHGSAHLDMGNIYFHQGKMSQALHHQSLLVTVGKTLREVVGALNNKGQLLKDLGLVKEALIAHTQALALKPEDGNTMLNVITARRQLCMWIDTDSWHDRLLEVTMSEIKRGEVPSLLPYDATLMAISDDVKKQIAIANSVQWDQSTRVTLTGTEATPQEQLRIGYISYDFRNHPMGQLTIGALEQHNHSRVQVFAYSYGPNDASEWRLRSEAASDVFRDVQESSDVAIATQIAADKIHILIDLMAHTRGSRVGIMGLKPAPIVVNYLGYPGTMGGSFTDYAIVDAAVVPPTRAADTFTEKLVYLPHTYQVNDYDWATPTTIEQTLRADGNFIFCNFNTINKMEPLSFDTWMHILHRVPHSVLYLLEPSRVDAGVMKTFLAEAAARGISPSRIFFAPRVPRALHLARLKDAHLFLDSFIYNAHTTASDMLWAYLPIVTLWGDTFASRVAASLVTTALNATIWTTYSIKEYEDLAVALATTNRPWLNKLRQQLAQRVLENPIFDNRRTTHHLEHAMMCTANLGPERMHIVVDPQDRKRPPPRSVDEIAAQLTQKTLALHQAGDLDTAEAGYMRLLDIYPTYHDALHLYGLLLYQRNNSKKALDYMLKSVEIMPNVGFYRGNLGQVYQSLNDTNNAIDEFDQALALDSQLPQVFLNYMTLLQSTKNDSGLIQVYEKYGEQLLGALSLKDQWTIRFDVSYALASKGSPHRAITCLEALIALSPPENIRIRAQYNMAALLTETGQYDHANELSMKTVLLEHRSKFRPGPKVEPDGGPVVVIYCHEYGQSWWSQWGPDSIYSGIGGSEEAVIYLSRELKALGYFVQVYANPPEAMIDEFGVVWYPHTEFDIEAKTDIFIAWRYHISTALSTQATKVYVWLHDMVSGNHFTPSYMETIDGIFCLSTAHAAVLSEPAKSKVIPTGNGLTPLAFVSGENLQTHFVYGSSPGRGLETVLEAWPSLRRRIPNATLSVFYGFTPAFVRYAQPSPSWRHRMEALLEQDGVTYVGLVDHDTLSHEYSLAGFYLYPTTYPETSCVSIMKAMAAGAIPITSKRGALAEVVGVFDLGPSEALIGPMTKEWQEKWVDAVVAAVAMDLRSFRKEMREYARETFSWAKIARQWHEEFTRDKDEMDVF